MQDRATAQSVLEAHWDSWITESDFEAIAAAGLVFFFFCKMNICLQARNKTRRLNHVRLPIGYWAFEVGPGEPYISGQLPYLQNAVTWAGNHGLKVIVDLHGLSYALIFIVLFQ